VHVWNALVRHARWCIDNRLGGAAGRRRERNIREWALRVDPPPHASARESERVKLPLDVTARRPGMDSQSGAGSLAGGRIGITLMLSV
jgi:hypothetical protein